MAEQETAREKRLREALRENLKRRKSQARGRAAMPASVTPASVASDGGDEPSGPSDTEA